jgi:uncharacterized protein YbjT (DUF2867 family)
MKRILVAGSTGYLGGFVCRELRARGYFVRALARSPEKLAPLRESLDEVVEAQITQPDSLEHVCDGIDVVFSSVGITRQKDGLTFAIWTSWTLTKPSSRSSRPRGSHTPWCVPPATSRT